MVIGMILYVIIILVLGTICAIKFEESSYDNYLIWLAGIITCGVLAFAVLIGFGMLHGYTNYYPSNDKDLARITAVTMEQDGNNPHYRVEVEYLTNSNGIVETDTFYFYKENNQLLEKAQDNLYKEVWIITGYKGGYETYKDFGTNLLKEIITKEEDIANKKAKEE